MTLLQILDRMRNEEAYASFGMEDTARGSNGGIGRGILWDGVVV